MKSTVATGEYDLKFDNSVKNADGASTFYNVAARTSSKQVQAGSFLVRIGNTSWSSFSNVDCI
jgi:hypothetical protein